MTIKELCELKKSGYTAEEIVHLNENGLVTIPEDIKPIEVKSEEVKEVKTEEVVPNPLEAENEKLKAELSHLQEVNRMSPVEEIPESDLAGEIIDMFR